MSYSGRFEITINAEGRRRVVPVRLGSADIGRSSHSAICLHDRNISRRHARLLRKGRKVWVEDLTSANGSFLNGLKICGRTRVFRNDVIRLGDVELELQGEGLRHRDDETTNRTGPLEFIALQEPQPHIKGRAERTLIVEALDDGVDADDDAPSAFLRDTDPSAAPTMAAAEPTDPPTAFWRDTDPTAAPKPPTTEPTDPPTAFLRDTDPTAAPELTPHPTTTRISAAKRVAARALPMQPTTEPQIVYRRRSGRPVLVLLVAAAIGSLLVAGALMLRGKGAAPTPSAPTAIPVGLEASTLERAAAAARAGRWLEGTRLAKEMLSVDPGNAYALNLLMLGTDAIRSDETLTAALAAKSHGDWRLCWRIINGVPPEQRTGTHNELITEVWHGLRITLLHEAMQSLRAGELTTTDKVLAELDALGIAGSEVNQIAELLQQQRRERRRARRRATRASE